MEEHRLVGLEAPLPGEALRKLISPHQSQRDHALCCARSQGLNRDWRTHNYCCFGALLLLLTFIMTVIYYANYPHPEPGPDSPAYFWVAYKLHLHPTWLVDIWRLPGYPLFLDSVYLLAGQRNLVAVGIAQALLFVLATLEIYVLALLILKHTWMAFLIGLIVGTNVILLSYIKPIMTEGLSLWLVTSLALAVVYFIRTLRIRAFWLIVVCVVPVLFTRPEWVYLPVLLFAYLLLVAWRRGSARRVVFNALPALFCIYALVAAYIGINTLRNQYPGLTAIENFNWLGKVLQYNMQDETAPQYAQYSRRLDILVAETNRSPYVVLRHMPDLSKDNAQPAGNFARTIILHHPFEFLAKSVPVFLPSLTHYYDVRWREPSGPFSVPLALMRAFDRILYRANAFFLLCVLFWPLLLCWRKRRSHPLILEMGAIILLAFYALVITNLGGYKFEDYMRVHIVFDTLLIFVVWGSFFLGAHFLVQRGPALSTHLVSRMRRH
jgi:hypothetical protein